MFSVSDNAIRLTRGNSATIEITPIDAESGDPIILSEGDVVLFTVKKPYGANVLQKTLTAADYGDDGTQLVCNLEPSETLALLSGEYKYDCLLLTSDGQAVTFISSSLTVTDAYGVYTDIGGGTG